MVRKTERQLCYIIFIKNIGGCSFSIFSIVQESEKNNFEWLNLLQVCVQHIEIKFMNSQKSGSTFSKQSIQRCCLGVQDNHFFQAYLSTYNYALSLKVLVTQESCSRKRSIVKSY